MEKYGLGLSTDTLHIAGYSGSFYLPARSDYAKCGSTYLRRVSVEKPRSYYKLCKRCFRNGKQPRFMKPFITADLQEWCERLGININEHKNKFENY